MRRAGAPWVGAVWAGQARWMNMSGAQQRKMQAEFFSAQKATDYDLDKEQWTKQMQWVSMDCILEPNVEPIRLTSFTGAKRWFGRWLTMRKLVERRPSFVFEELEGLYKQYRMTSNGGPNEVKLLPRLTTHGESKRIKAEVEKRAQKKTVGTKWKDISQQALSGKSEYELEVTSFELINAYMGQMTNEDWVQLTVKVVGKQRMSASVPLEEFVEYPVFEAKLGDGIKVLNTSPFIIVAVMDRDGARYGKDGQDAATLRKALARQSKSWFS